MAIIKTTIICARVPLGINAMLSAAAMAERCAMASTAGAMMIGNRGAEAIKLPWPYSLVAQAGVSAQKSQNKPERS